MPGPAPNPNRQRRNKAPTAARPPAWASALRKGRPALPNRGPGRAWHKDTKRWWEHVWSSPHAWRYSDVELDGLLRLAEIEDAINGMALGDPKRLPWLAEARMQRRDFGLTPADRLRLQWKEDEQPDMPTAPPGGVFEDDEDPRAVLRAVK